MVPMVIPCMTMRPDLAEHPDRIIKQNRMPVRIGKNGLLLALSQFKHSNLKDNYPFKQFAVKLPDVYDSLLIISFSVWLGRMDAMHLSGAGR